MSLTDVPGKAPQVRQTGYEGSDQVQRALDSITRPLNASLAFLNAIFTGNASAPTLALSGLTLTGALVGTTAAFSGALSAASAAITGAISGASLAISGNATVGGTLGVTGAVTGASYSGGPVSGTTGTFSGAISGGSYTGGSSAAGTPSVLGLTVGTTGIASSGPVNAGTQLVTGDLTNCIGIRVPLITFTQAASTIAASGSADFPTNLNSMLWSPYNLKAIAISARWVSARNTAGTLTFYTHRNQNGVDTLDSGQSITIGTTGDGASLVFASPVTLSSATPNGLAIRCVSSVGFSAGATCYVTATLWAVITS